ncbi:hypothetical protein GCM10025877_15730 [Agromyces mangrovi Wang et al. 2018]|nr:hypothetical protein GCM10025877_15730 [Agromyces mangrovi]
MQVPYVRVGHGGSADVRCLAGTTLSPARTDRSIGRATSRARHWRRLDDGAAFDAEHPFGEPLGTLRPIIDVPSRRGAPDLTPTMTVRHTCWQWTKEQHIKNLRLARRLGGSAPPFHVKQ